VTIIDIDALLSQVRDVMDKAGSPCSTCSCSRWPPGSWCCSRRSRRRATSAATRAQCCARWVRAGGSCSRVSPPSSRRSPPVGCSLRRRDVGRYFLAREIFNLKYAPDPLSGSSYQLWCAARGIAGVLAARSVVTHPPVETLRQSVSVRSRIDPGPPSEVDFESLLGNRWSKSTRRGRDTRRLSCVRRGGLRTAQVAPTKLRRSIAG